MAGGPQSCLVWLRLRRGTPCSSGPPGAVLVLQNGSRQSPTRVAGKAQAARCVRANALSTVSSLPSSSPAKALRSKTAMHKAPSSVNRRFCAGREQRTREVVAREARLIRPLLSSVWVLETEPERFQCVLELDECLCATVSRTACRDRRNLSTDRSLRKSPKRGTDHISGCCEAAFGALRHSHHVAGSRRASVMGIHSSIAWR